MTLGIQIAKFKFRQYQLKAIPSSNLRFCGYEVILLYSG